MITLQHKLACISTFTLLRDASAAASLPCIRSLSNPIPCHRELTHIHTWITHAPPIPVSEGGGWHSNHWNAVPMFVMFVLLTSIYHALWFMMPIISFADQMVMQEKKMRRKGKRDE
jgi:hypothetical protein